LLTRAFLIRRIVTRDLQTTLYVRQMSMHRGPWIGRAHTRHENFLRLITQCLRR